MMRALIIAGVVAILAAVGLGVWAGQNQAPTESVVAVRQNAPLVAKPGREAAGAAKAFAKLEPPPPPKPLPPPGPPPIDVAVTFRHEVRALAPDQGRVILAGARSLKLGDKYGDGWKLTGLTNRTATLTKGKELRTVDFFQPDPAAVQALAAQNAQAAAGFAQVSFTNGLKPGQLPASVAAQLFSMMRQGGLPQTQIDQMKKALDNGGGNQATLMPIVMAMARNGRVPVAELNRFVESLGRANIVPEQQIPSIEQSIQAVAQSRQTDGIVQQLNRPGQPVPGQFGGRPGPGGGFNGGFNNGGRRGPQGAPAPPLPNNRPAAAPAARPAPGAQSYIITQDGRVSTVPLTPIR